MKTAPKTAPTAPRDSPPPESPDNILPLPEPSAKPPKFPRVHFTHRGRRMTLFKVSHEPDAPWYVHFEIGGRRHKISLKTNVQRIAFQRTSQEFDKAMHSHWSGEPEPERKRVSPAPAEPVTTPGLDKLVEVYLEKSPCYRETRRKHVWSLRFMLKTLGFPADLKQVKLCDIDGPLVARFQNKMVENYTAKVKGANACRAARELALRSSRSMLGQVRSIFTRKGNLPDEYAAAGIVMPPSIAAFTAARRLGKATKSQYHPPADEVINGAFANVETLREKDPQAYKVFWLSVGAGLRRGEVRRLEVSHFALRDGRMWISGGIGKDGEFIEVPIQKLAWEKLKPFHDAAQVPPLRRDKRFKHDRFILGHDRPARRLNKWMAEHGWSKTEKKMHELRAYIGSLIYRENPYAAMKFMRHKSIKTTEQYYCRYCGPVQPIDVL